MENKKELLEMALKLAKECEKHELCDGCPLVKDDICLLDLGDGAISILNRKLNELKFDSNVNKPVIGEGHCPDNVNHPKHYETGKFECIDVMIETQGVEAVKNFCICNAFKYVYRHKYKNACEDIRKAIWYLNKFVELEGGK